MKKKGRWNFKIKRISDLPSFDFEGMRVAPVITAKETETMVAYHIRIPKNRLIPRSYHKKAHEIIHVLDGCGKVCFNGREFRIRQGDVLLIQPGTWHSFSTGNKEMELMAVTAPRVDGNTDLYHK